MIPGSVRSPGEGISYPLQFSWASLVVQKVKNLPAMWETLVQSPGWKDPLEKGKDTHSSILAWRIPTDGGAWWAIAHGVAKSQAGLSDFHFHPVLRGRQRPNPTFCYYVIGNEENESF